MIKNLLLILTSFILISGIEAQTCSPDTTLKTHGYYPAELDSATEMTQYNMTMQVYSKRDTMVDNPFGGGQVSATIDSIIVKQVTGMPSGLSFACNPGNCRFVSLKAHCINIYGTPEQATAGVYPLRIVVDVKATINGSFPVTQEEEITDFSIVVKDDNISAIKHTLGVVNAVSFYPNPFKDNIEVKLGSAESGTVSISNALGQVLKQDKISNQSSLVIDTELLSAGVYFVNVQLLSGAIYTQKLIKK